MKGGDKQWELTARSASFSDDKKTLRLQDADLSIIAQDGKHVNLHAPIANLAMLGNRVTRADLSGGLEVHYGEVVITAQQAAFSPEVDDLSVPGLVTIEGQGLKVTGVGMTAHPRAEVFDLHQQVNTEINPAP